MDRSLVPHDWNTPADVAAFDWAATRVTVQDETLRDGAQGASVTDPPIADKRTLLHRIAALGVQSVDLGFPASGPRAAADVVALARELAAARLPLAATCAARTILEDVWPIAAATQASGVPIEVATFIGSSPIRQAVEGWTLDDICRRVETAVAGAVGAGQAVMFVAEDSTRATPDMLLAIGRTAIGAGAGRICLCDTVGHATPAGAARLVRFVRDAVVGPSGAAVGIDWHGHRDRALGLANALAAIEAGADRVHATALGIGERVGNVAMETLLLNLYLLGVDGGAWGARLHALPDYAAHAAAAYGVPIPAGQPVVGPDAFTTGTGVHAAAILKARAQGDAERADLVYAAFAPAVVGRTHRVAISPFSGAANVRWWLSERGLDADDPALVAAILRAAKASTRALTDGEILAVVGSLAQRAGSH